MTVRNHLEVGGEVAESLSEGGGVVALESTIVTHGMPYPRNVETALAVEDEVRRAGAVPATIAVVEGRLRVGLSSSEIDELGRSAEPGLEVAKVSRRDLPFLVANGGTGGTTVAATMIVAALAGIRVFATGGIGGVHRGGHRTFDISADLDELARTPVTVVSAGFKSVLDLGLTLEYLETRGVPVVGYGTDVLPAFYSRDSDFELVHRADGPDAVAAMMCIADDLGLGGGMVVANPIPAEHSIDRVEIDAAIDRALADADAQGVAGKDTTPFLLARIVELTGEASLDANIQLVYNNARVAAAIACAYRFRS